MSRSATSVSIYLSANIILNQSLDTKLTPEDSLRASINPAVTSEVSWMETEAVQMRTGVMCTSSMKKDKVEKL